MRIYLDWNIYKIHKNDSIPGLSDALDDLRGKVLFPYSPAHIDDARKMLESEKGKSFFKSDLDYLFNISGEYILNYDGERVQLQLGHPLDYHKSTPDEQRFLQEFSISAVFDKIGDAAEELGVNGVSEIFKQAFSLTPGFVGENGLETAYPDVPFFQSKNGWEIMENMFPFVEQLTYNRDFYFNFSNTFRDVEIQVDKNSGNWLPEEVIPKINDLLRKTNTSFEELISIPGQPEEKNWFKKFYSAWLMLDWLGYKRDKLKNRNSTMKNIVNDLNHAFYGAHCAMLVTDDANLRAKAKALYDYWRIETRILSPREFLPYAHQLLTASRTNDIDLFATILQITTDAESEYTFKFMNFHYRAWKIEGYLLNHFNVILESPTPFTDRRIALVRQEATLEGGLFYEEARMLAEECFRLFGGDDELANTDQIIDDFTFSRTNKIRWDFSDVQISLFRSPQGIALFYDSRHDMENLKVYNT